MLEQSIEPLAGNPGLRQQLVDLKKSKEQTIDAVSQDVLLEASYSEAAKERAKALVQSFEQFIRDHKDEIVALQVLYSRPYSRRFKYDEIRALADRIQAPPRSWTPESLWRAYETLDASKVRRAPARVLSTIVSLVRYAIRQDGELVPFPDVADKRFVWWLAQQESRGRAFTDEQRWGEVPDRLIARAR